MLRRLYDWVLHWAETPYGTWALFVLSFSEASFFPIPPDLLLIALAISLPMKSFRFAFICSVASVLGGMFGYFIGYGLMDSIGRPILEIYNAMDRYEYIQTLYRKYDAWAVMIAGFTPLPYKVCTITAGAFKIDLLVFILASVVSRSARFFLVAGLIYRFGEPIKSFIDRYFNILSIVFVILLILGFIVLKGVL
ncbi:MAG: DedA family protein [Nitrospinae bacterium]|nr:DedA family protein [Nitrospinota bacterium]